MMAEQITLRTEHTHLLTRDQAWHYRILPKNNSEGQVTFYCSAERHTADLVAELEILLGRPVSLEAITDSQVARLLSTYYPRNNEPGRRMTFWRS
jgi:type IV pilus assembly protein PilB